MALDTLLVTAKNDKSHGSNAVAFVCFTPLLY